MPRLQEFVGTREYPPKPPVATSSFAMHPNSKNERMRVIMQGLASSTDAQKTKSVYGSRDDVFLELKPNKGENIGSFSPSLGVPDVSSGSLITNSRWLGYRSAVRAPHSTNDPESQDQDPMEETSPGHDIFGTDIENLDSTIASSDFASSDFGDIQGRYEQEDDGNGVSANSDQHLSTGQPQQGSMLLKREYREYRDDNCTVPLDNVDYLQGPGGKDRQRIIDQKSNNPKLDGMDSLPRKFHNRALEGNAGLSLQRSPRAANIRGISAPNIITKPIPNLIHSSNSKELSASTVDSALTHGLNTSLHASNGKLGVRSLHAGESRWEEDKESEGDRYYHISRGSSEAEVNHFILGQGKGDVIKDVPLNSRQRGSSFSYRPDNLRQREGWNHSSAQLNGRIHQQTREEPSEQGLEYKATNDFQNVAHSKLSNGLLELYDTRGSIDAHSKQEAFFSALEITQSERCGDFFIERFVDIMAKYNAVRRQRREIATALECEITGREAQVSTRREDLDRNLDELRQAGKGVVRGKSSTVN